MMHSICQHEYLDLKCECVDQFMLYSGCPLQATYLVNCAGIILVWFLDCTTNWAVVWGYCIYSINTKQVQFIRVALLSAKGCHSSVACNCICTVLCQLASHDCTVFGCLGLYWRVQMMDMLVFSLLFLVMTGVSTWLVAFAYKKVKFNLRHKWVPSLLCVDTCVLCSFVLYHDQDYTMTLSDFWFSVLYACKTVSEDEWVE